jgi:hypothetical protein
MEWKPLKRYEGLYEINEAGDVKSVDRFLPAGKHDKRIYKGQSKKKVKGNQFGHLKYYLWKDNKVEQAYIHRLVAENYLSNPNNYPVVMHMDDDPSNNHVSNLQWGTQKMNSKDMVAKGRWNNQFK